MYDYLIVGAGLFGAVCAERLTGRGRRCLVVDRRPHVAGNAYTETVAGVRVHRYGAHIFHTGSRAVWDYINRFAEFNNFINSPVAVYGDELYNLPFNMNTFSRLFGVRTPAEAKARIDEEKVRCGVAEPRNLEEQAISLVGVTVYEKLVKGYTAKQWGRPCRELPAFIIKRLPVRFTYDNNYFSDRYQGIPIGGYTPIIEKMLQGSEVRLGVDYLKEPGLRDLAPRVIYSGAVDEYFGYRLGALAYRSVRFEDEILDCPNRQGVAVVNYTSEDVPYTRVIEHKHFELDSTSPQTVISREYSSAWEPGAEPYYPVNDERNDALYRRYAALAEGEPGVYFGGRLGCYRYMDMDDTIESALRLVEELEPRYA